MYFLEECVDCVKKMPYSYERRALGTLHSTKWVQRCVCEARKPLEDLLAQLNGIDDRKYKITSNCPEGEKQ